MDQSGNSPKLLPKLLISLFRFLYRLRVVFNKIGQKLSTIDLDCEFPTLLPPLST